MKFAENSHSILIWATVFLTYKAAVERRLQIANNRGRFVETYLSIEGLAKYLEISEKTVRKWVLNNEIPYHKIMKIIRFRISEIEEWINTSGKFNPVHDGEAQDGELFEETETQELSEETGGEA